MGVVKITYEYAFGDIVYAISDPGQIKMIVTGYLVEPADQIVYRTTGIHGTIFMYGFELTNEKSIE